MLLRGPPVSRHLLGGGPVATGGGLYLHSGMPAEEGSHEACYNRAALRGSDGDGGEEGGRVAGSEVLPGVHFMSSTAFVRCALADPQGPQLRLFLGHSGWGARQLDGEWRAGAWRLCGATAAAVFAADVGRLWDEMTSGELGFSLCTQIPQSEETWSVARGQGRPSEQLRAGGQDWGEERDIDIVD